MGGVRCGRILFGPGSVWRVMGTRLPRGNLVEIAESLWSGRQGRGRPSCSSRTCPPLGFNSMHFQLRGLFVRSSCQGEATNRRIFRLPRRRAGSVLAGKRTGDDRQMLVALSEKIRHSGYGGYALPSSPRNYGDPDARPPCMLTPPVNEAARWRVAAAPALNRLGKKNHCSRG
jgi:hypothetical protein